ncbi:MAG TPA: nuclear transport factor 2 family protein [Sphingomicrobium sp.]|nr:nuclear transport factor 2 family protein [Sphingomicrobium sp.]
MTGNKQQIIDLETRFWQSMKDKDVEAAQAMVADESLVTGPHGTMRADPAKFGQLMREAPWTLDEFKMTDVDVIFPADDVAVITYKVHETGEMEGKPMDMTAADSTVWARHGDRWKVALHTETILEDAKSRQREPA